MRQDVSGVIQKVLVVCPDSACLKIHRFTYLNKPFKISFLPGYKYSSSVTLLDSACKVRRTQRERERDEGKTDSERMFRLLCVSFCHLCVKVCVLWVFLRSFQRANLRGQVLTFQLANSQMYFQQISLYWTE